MPQALPAEIPALLAEGGPLSEAAWERFVAEHTRLLLHVIRTVVHDPDLAMDAYTWVLERFHEDGARRLRGFDPGKSGRFTTWLVVVARRTTIDFLRHVGGRSGGRPCTDGRVIRRRLLALTGEPVDLDTLAQPDSAADLSLDQQERHDALLAALAELDPLDRLLLTLRFEDGLEAQQIARTLHLPTRFHVYRRLTHVLAQLRTRLNGRGIHGAA